MEADRQIEEYSLENGTGVSHLTDPDSLRKCINYEDLMVFIKNVVIPEGIFTNML